jgi:hypothetical protein
MTDEEMEMLKTGCTMQFTVDPKELEEGYKRCKLDMANLRDGVAVVNADSVRRLDDGTIEVTVGSIQCRTAIVKRPKPVTYPQWYNRHERRKAKAKGRK